MGMVAQLMCQCGGAVFEGAAAPKLLHTVAWSARYRTPSVRFRDERPASTGYGRHNAEVA